MRTLFVCAYLAIIAFVQVTGVNEIPNTYKRCKIDANVNQCMKAAINDALPKLINGYKELGLPQLQPFFLKKMLFDNNDKGPVRIRQEFNNVVIPDLLEKTIVTDFIFDIEKKETVLAINLPIMNLEGDYSITGQILVLPIQGNGKFNVKYTNLDLRFNMKFEEKMKNGETYYHFTSVETFMKPEKMEMHLENLFNGDKALSESTNEFLNDNWKDIFTELEPDYSKYFSGICLKVINKFFGSRPVNKIFLE